MSTPSSFDENAITPLKPATTSKIFTLRKSRSSGPSPDTGTRHVLEDAEKQHPTVSAQDEVAGAGEAGEKPKRRDFATVACVEEEKDERDLRKRQEYAGGKLFWLVYQSIGVIYGDIGTSPLYVYSSTFSSEPSHSDLLGALSLIIWTLTLMVSIKYVLIVLRADDEGEGGTFAVYSLLSRYADIVRRDPREEQFVRMQRAKSNEMGRTSRGARNLLEGSGVLKAGLKVVGVFGVSLVMSDGVLTPAQSVLGAIQGLRVADESISTPTIVGTSCGILILLFLIQPLGTSKLGSTFAPIVIIWLLFNLTFGIYNLVKFDAGVLRAFSPFFAGDFLVRNKTEGWKALGGVLLAFTGVEALFADLGAFSRHSIQISWLAFGYPCLLVAYTGQAAYISQNKNAYSNPFFNSVPPGMFYPSLVVAVLAAIVASQTMITATFQLLSQIVKLSYFPQIKVIYTSKTFFNQIYIPWVNWLLMVGTIAVTAAYNDTTKLGHAYGVCVILVTFLTTCMVSLVALVVWRIPALLVLFGFLVFGCLDGVYLSSALTKVPDGAWFTLILAVLLSSIFVLWRFGKENQWRAEAEDRVPLSHFLSQPGTPGSRSSSGTPRSTSLAAQESPGSQLRLSPSLGSHALTRFPGLGIFFDKSGLPYTAPQVFTHFLLKFRALPRIVVFLHIRPLSIPTVDPEDRFTVSACHYNATAARDTTEDDSSDGQGRGKGGRVPDFYRITLRHGYLDNVVTTDLSHVICDELDRFVIRDTPSSAVPTPSTSPAPTTSPAAATTSSSSAPSPDLTPEQTHTRRRLRTLQSAYEDQIVHIVGKEQLRIREAKGVCRGGGVVRKMALAAFLWIRAQTGTRVRNMEVEVERIVEVGFVKMV